MDEAALYQKSRLEAAGLVLVGESVYLLPVEVHFAAVVLPYTEMQRQKADLEEEKSKEAQNRQRMNKMQDEQW